MRLPQTRNAPPAGAGEAHKAETVAGLEGDYSTTRPAAQLTDRPEIGEIVHIYFVGRARVISHDHPEPMITLRTYAGVIWRCSRHQVIGLGVRHG